jgi:drug/metabolite transporter (DMT)-like permease
VTGALWAASAGIGFGLFQSLNRRATADVGNAYVSTFLQLVVALVVLVGICATTGDLSRLGDATAWSLIAFSLAGVVHFLLGWTFLNLSQDRIGAARTSPLTTMTPIFGIFVAAAVYGEVPTLVALGGIAVAVVGAYVVARGDDRVRIRPRDAVFGLTTALMWALSPILTLEGLKGLHSPLLGVTIGVAAAAVAYAVMLAVSGIKITVGKLDSAPFKLAVGVLVAVATWFRFIALDHTQVATVLALNMLAVPVVLIVAPLVAGRHVERVTLKVWAGSLLVIAGALILILEG